MTKLIKDREFVRSGNFVASPGPWSADLDPSITDYENTIVIGDGNKALFSWRWPDKASPFGVWGYNYISYGTYWEYGPKAYPVAPLQLGKVKYFDFSYDVEMLGADKANLLCEFFATSKAGDIGSRQVEIGWMMNMPDASRAWFNTGKLVGTFSSRGGHKWIVRSHQSGATPLFVMIAPADGRDMLSGTIDALSAIKFLIGADIIKSDWWVNGHALGFEPLGGAGGAYVSRFGVALR